MYTRPFRRFAAAGLGRQPRHPGRTADRSAANERSGRVSAEARLPARSALPEFKKGAIVLKKKKSVLLIVGIIVAVLLILLGLVNFFTDWIWFGEMGYTSVFWKELLTKLTYGVPIFVLITVGCYFYLQAMKKGYYKKIGGYESLQPEKKVNVAAGIISAVFGLLAAVPISNRLWFQMLQFANSTDFNIADPIFGYDVSFYVFKLEFLSEINNLLIPIIIGFAVVNVIFYLLLFRYRKPYFLDEVSQAEEEPREEPRNNSPFGQFFGGGQNPFGGGRGGMFGMGGGRSQGSRLNRDTISRLIGIAGRQFRVLGVLLFLMIGLHYFLKQFTLLYASSSGVVYGAGFTDINITLWVYRILMILSLVAAVMFVIGMNKRSLKKAVMVPVIMIGVSIAGGLVSLLVQNLIVTPDEINKEYAYLENNIAFTRSAYDLQDIEVREFPADNTLTSADIANNMQTISNIRINDYEPALKFYNQTQSIRLYYQFNDVDVDRYMVNGEYTQTFLSAREIDESAVTDQWMNSHLIYTHGYGITLSRVDKVTDSGQPDMMIDSIPPVSDVEEITIDRPEIYFGESTNSYVVVNTDEPEFDYPSGDSNVYTEYEGTAGINMTLLNRILFAIREGNINLLVSTNIDSDSKILINRNIMERVQTIAPFLSYDEDPYIVTVDGKLYWIIDAYTTSSYYPYSEPFAENTSINYIRNSVKVIIDAYNGDTDFYIVEDDDPIAQTYQKIYPDLFKDLEEMPDSLRAHLRYPNTLFSIQAQTYAKYHMTDVNVFYQNEDRWDIAKEIYGTEETTMVPTYYITKIPGEEEAEFITNIPYTPSGKDNMTALLIARNDGEHYGELLLFQMPKDRTIYGPRQIEARINQHTEIAQDFTLWSSAGSTYTRGNIFVIPIENSLIYVEPIYLESANSSLPEVKRVIIYYNERIAYENTLAEALDAMFGEGASSGYEEITGPTTETPGGEGDAPPADEPALGMSELADLANQAFNNALNAQRDGDWAAYGEYLDELQGYLNQMTN